MSPTLKVPDKLFAIPFDNRKIRRGDIIAFIPPNENKIVTHRVISITLLGIRTQGDNSYNVDSWILSPDNIIGQIVYVQRRNKKRRILGGIVGISIVAMRRSITHVIGRKVSKFLSVPYYKLARKGIFRHCLPPWWEMKIISLNRPEGTELHLFLGRCVIGRFLSRTNQWYIRRPFRLFVDESSLPRQDIAN